MPFKSLLLANAVLLVSSLSFAAPEKLLCWGSLKEGARTTVSVLNPSSGIESAEFSGTLNSSLGTFLLEMSIQSDGYHYKVQWQDNAELVIDEVVPEVPAVRSKTLPEGQEIDLECKPHHRRDYCRLHTC